MAIICAYLSRAANVVRQKPAAAREMCIKARRRSVAGMSFHPLVIYIAEACMYRSRNGISGMSWWRLYANN